MPEQPIAKARSHPLKADPGEGADGAAAAPVPLRRAALRHELHVPARSLASRRARGPGGELGYHALAITDRHSLAGVVRAHVAAKAVGLKLLIGAEVPLEDAATVSCSRSTAPGYGELSKLLTSEGAARKKAAAPSSRKRRRDARPGLIAIGIADEDALRPDGNEMALRRAAGRLSWLAPPSATARAPRLSSSSTDRTTRRGSAASTGSRAATGLPRVAAGAVEAHAPERRALRDVLLAVGHGCTVADLGSRIPAHGARVLRGPAEIERRTGAVPSSSNARSRSRRLHVLARRAQLRVSRRGRRFALRELVEENAAKRWPDGMPAKVRALVEHELALIKELDTSVTSSPSTSS